MEIKSSQTLVFSAFFLVVLLLVFDIVIKAYAHIAAVLVLYITYRVIGKHTKEKIEVKGQGVFITGCDTGFGHGIALRLAKCGFTVFAGCLHAEGEGASALVANGGENLHVVPLDVTNDESVSHALEFVQKHKPKSGIWAVINNAAIKCTGGIEFSQLGSMKRAMEVNFYGIVRVTKAFLPLIRQSQGRVVNVSSAKGRLAVAWDAAYVNSKWACEGFSDVLRREMYRFGVKVAIIEPGNFGAVTSIFKGESLRLAEADVNECWEVGSEEIKAAYGRECIDSVIKSLRNAPTVSCTTMEPVLNAMQDAVENVHPKCRYLVHGTDTHIDNACVLAVLNQFLPEPLMDFIYRIYFPLPAVQQQVSM